MMQALGNTRPLQFLNLGVLGFLFVSVLLPWSELYRGFFYALAIPALLYIWFKKDGKLKQYKPSVVLFFCLILYVVLSSVFIGDAEISDRVRRIRWALQNILFFFCILYVAPIWMRNALIYGTFFLYGVLFACLFAIVGRYVFDTDVYFKNWGGRLSWFGFLSHPIQGPSVLMVLWGIGISLVMLSKRYARNEFILFSVSSIVLFTYCFLTKSRGPIIAYSIYFLIFSLFVIVFVTQRRWVYSFALMLLIVLSYLGISMFLDVSSAIASMINRADSHRLDIWKAILEHSSSSLWFGSGIAVDFKETAAGLALGQRFDHGHNLFLNTYNTLGVVGCFWLGLFMLSIIIGLIKASIAFEFKGYGLLLLLLVLLLNATDAFRIVSAPRPDWVVLWLPLVFVLSISQWNEQEEVN